MGKGVILKEKFTIQRLHCAIIFLPVPTFIVFIISKDFFKQQLKTKYIVHMFFSKIDNIIPGSGSKLGQNSGCGSITPLPRIYQYWILCWPRASSLVRSP